MSPQGSSLKHVPQIDRMGCGIACVAMVAGVSYEKAKTLVRTRPNRSGNSTYYADLKWALDRLGVRYEMNGRNGFKFKSWSEMEGRAIVAIDQDPQGKSGWHWVVFDRTSRGSEVLDPDWSGNGVRTDFSRMRGRSYIRIHAAAKKEQK